MGAISYRQFGRLYVADRNRAMRELCEAIDDERSGVTCGDLSIRRLAESVVGHEWVNSLNPHAESHAWQDIMETADAVKVADFVTLTQQFVMAKVREAFATVPRVFTDLIPTIPSSMTRETISAVSTPGDEAVVIDEGMPYPLAGMAERKIETPETKKRGFAVQVTQEVVFFDQTGIVMRNAALAGEGLALNKEIRVIDAVIDGNTTAHRFRVDGTTYATYQIATPWDNQAGVNVLADYTDIDNAELVLLAMTDPDTGEHFILPSRHLVCPPALRATANRVRNATAIGDDSALVTSANPVDDGTIPAFRIVTSQLLADRQSAASVTANTWYWGDITRAFAYIENWPLSVVQDTSDTGENFMRDVVATFKARERGAAAVIEPRAIVRNDPS